MKAIAPWVLTSLILVVTACAPTPAAIKLDKELYVLDGADASDQIKVAVLDPDGNEIKEGVDIVFFSMDTKTIKLTTDGKVSAVSSGEAKVEVEVVGTELKEIANIRVKIPSGIEASHEKLRLWTGQVKENVCAWVVSEKEAFIEGYLPEWTSEDPTIVAVEAIPDPVKDPKRNRSYVKMTGLKSGDTFVHATYKHLTTSLRIRVYDEDEEVSLDGARKPKPGEAPAATEEKEE